MAGKDELDKLRAEAEQAIVKSYHDSTVPNFRRESRMAAALATMYLAALVETKADEVLEELRAPPPIRWPWRRWFTGRGKP